LLKTCNTFDADAAAPRLGGNEFAIIQRDFRNPDEPLWRSGYAPKSQSRFRSRDMISVSACIGYALCPHASAELDELLGLADQALYAKKARSWWERA
jgi:predicted signal transduction protein with EAL and GGDEF domain